MLYGLRYIEAAAAADIDPCVSIMTNVIAPNIDLKIQEERLSRYCQVILSKFELVCNLIIAPQLFQSF